MLIVQKDLDGRELKFLKDNRPRRRYLYFRFIISYLNARKLGFSDVAAKIGKRPFWPSGGDYLNRSTLRTLARYVSGADIPESLVEANTFDHPDDPTRATEAGMVIGAAMEHHGARGPDPRAAVAESMSRLEIRD